MPNWLDFLKKKEESDDPKVKEQAELELKNITDGHKKVETIETELKTMKESQEKDSKRLNTFLDEQEAAKRRRIADEAARKAAEKKESDEKDMDDLWLTDPKEAARRTFEDQSKGLVEATINNQSQTLRRQIFDDNPNEYEYYTKENPEFKAQVDALIDQQPLNIRSNPEAIKNAYAIIAHRKAQEIKEGKLKSRFAATSTSSTGTTSSKDKDTIVLTDLQKKAAKNLGISEEDYGKTAKEMNYV